MITIISVGEAKNNNIRALTQEYLKRLSSQRIFLKSVKEEKGTDAPQVKKKEGERLLQALKEDAFVVVLSEEGTLMNSIGFADSLKKKKEEKNITFVIGGAFGLDSAVKKRAHLLLSLSPLTFPHEIALLLLVEQIYRAEAILAGKPYHK